jgi:hypothetical protein
LAQVLPNDTKKLNLKIEFPVPTYSVEKLPFGAEAIFQFYGIAAENLKKTRRMAD